VESGGEVLSGSINLNGLLTIRVTKEFGESTAAKILDLVQNAGSKKAPVENFITRFARYYTPAVVFAALALAFIPPLVSTLSGGIGIAGFGDVFPSWLHRALVFLVVSCPCALVISIPLSFFGGIGGASRQGILVKGGNYLEALNKADRVVFDKTGTLTRGVFTVTEIVAQPGISREDLLYYAAAAENYSNHPIALSIRKAWTGEIDQGAIRSHEEIPGRGVRLDMGGKTVLAGNARLLEEQRILCPGTFGSEIEGSGTDAAGTVVYVAIDSVYRGHLVIADELKPGAGEAVRALRARGIRGLYMLTGDKRRTSEKIGAELGLDGVYAELLPQDKVAKIEELANGGNRDGAPGGKIVFVGDGINDAPVLARSDIGVAMGGAGQDAAIEAADIVLMTDEPGKLVTAIGIARKTHAIVIQNIVLALGVKGLILVLGALGIASMWAAVFGDVGVAFLAILNAMRAMK
jgi:Cd2+/Zn2+-exporting ATPase